MKDNKRIIVAVSGASGMIYAVRFLRAVPDDYEVHLIVSPVARNILKSETGWNLQEESLQKFLGRVYRDEKSGPDIIVHAADNYYAPVASGSFMARKMVVVPCSVKTLAGIANGFADSLIGRAADVQLKEKGKLVLVVRETPLNLIQIENMLKAGRAGATILPANPAFYQNPSTIEDLADFIAARILNVLDIPQNLIKGWGETD